MRHRRRRGPAVVHMRSHHGSTQPRLDGRSNSPSIAHLCRTGNPLDSRDRGLPALLGFRPNGVHPASTTGMPDTVNFMTGECMLSSCSSGRARFFSMPSPESTAEAKKTIGQPWQSDRPKVGKVWRLVRQHIFPRWPQPTLALLCGQRHQIFRRPPD